MTTYIVEFVSQGVASNRDATEMRLRLYVDGEYRQFFIALASGISLSGLEPGPGFAFWRCFAEDAADLILTTFVEAAEEPQPDPGTAIFLTPNVQAAFHRSRACGANETPLHPSVPVRQTEA